MPTAKLVASMLMVATLCLHGTAVQADEPRAAQFPINVRVTADHSYLRAGPSGDFYPTERLLEGNELEVWAIDPSGFCAVRPLAGSFSWLRASDVSLDGMADTAADERAAKAGGTIGVVVTDGTVCRVGSQLNDLRHVAQVRLEAGERVRGQIGRAHV